MGTKNKLLHSLLTTCNICLTSKYHRLNFVKFHQLFQHCYVPYNNHTLTCVLWVVRPISKNPYDRIKESISLCPEFNSSSSDSVNSPQSTFSIVYGWRDQSLLLDCSIRWMDWPEVFLFWSQFTNKFIADFPQAATMLWAIRHVFRNLQYVVVILLME